MRKCFLSWVSALIHRFRMPLMVVPRVPTKTRNLYKGMESLESRALMAANVLTDLPDYLPGDTAIISAWNDNEAGADFAAGETVLFQVTRTDGVNDLPNGNLPWFVTDGVGGFDGYFVDSDNNGSNDFGVFPDTDGTVNAALGTTWFVEEQYFKSTLLLTATGQSSSAVATWEFTDGGSFSVSPGDGTLSVNVAPGSNANLADVTLTVPKNNGLQTPTIAFSGAPTGVTITYLALLDSDAANAVGTVNTGGAQDNAQTIVYRMNIASTTSVSPGTYPIRVTFAASTGTINTPNNQWDFDLVILAADGSGSLGVGTQTGTATYGGTTENVTFAIDATRQSNGNFSGTYSVSGLPTDVTGSFNPTSFTSTGSNAFTDSVLTLTVPGTVSPGSYPFTVSLTNTSNSTFVQSFGTLVVQRAGLSIAANSLSKTYGNTLTLDNTTPGDFAVTGLFNSDAVTSITLTSSGAIATSNVGSYSIVPSAAVGSGLSNYDITYNNGSLSVQTRAVTISVDAKSKTYADANPALTATEGNTVAGAAALDYTLATTAGQFSDVGSYPISITLGSNPNYSVTTTAGSLTVNQRSVTVTADAKSKTYADANPALTATEGNTVAGAAALDYTLATTAGQFSDVGSYPISITLGSNPNYSVTKTDGSLAVNQRSVTVTADAKSKIYADTNPALTATETNTVAGAAALDYTLATTASQFSDVGSYPISITLGSNPNYSVTTPAGSLTVNQRSVTVTADAKSKTYADANPALTATETNTVAGAAALQYSLATNAGQFSDVGSYTIAVSLGSNPNYSVTTTAGSLTVNQRSVTVTADAKSKIYGDANPALTATETNTVAGAAALNYSLATNAGQFSDVGSYAITVSLGSNPNYSVTTTDGSLTVNQRSVTVTADAKSKIYGDADPSLTYAVTSGSVVNGDSFSGSLSRATGENVGTYAINQGSVSLGSNYSLSYVGANLTINQRAATIVANAFTRLFGEANPTFTAVVSGTANNETLNYSLTTVATQFSPVGSYTILVSLGSNPNYSVVTTPATLTIEERDAAARYIGQTIAVASGSSATSAQVSLAASVQDPTGLGLVGAKVTFIDTLTNRVLASNVPVSPVAGSPFNGTANTFVTLSTGTYGSQLYNVKVIVTGNYTNEAQLSGSSASITVTKPAGTEMISASGRIAQSSGVAGTYGVTVSGDATFSVDLKYNKSGKNLQGKVELLLPSSDGSQIYIKSNALNSMVIDGQKVNGTVYVKANATRLNADGTTTTLEGNISLRIDLSEANSGMVAITAMSSTSQLLYSNDWYFDETLRGWKSRLSAVSSGLIQLN